MSHQQLSPAARHDTVQRLRTIEYDILIVGGGVTGAGAALDAAARGLRVALVEMRDYASGTSSRSGKLIHGGLRYLEQLNFRLVRESLKERRLLLTTLAPHLLTPIRFLLPLTHRVWERAYMGAGLILYDTLGGAGAVPRHRHLSHAAVRKLAPGLRADGLVGAITFYDAQIDDARHTVELVRTAASRGADVASAIKVVGLSKRGGAVVGAEVMDLESGDTFTIAAHQVVNASGVWTDGLQAMAGGTPSFTIKASKGVHIMVRREKLPSEVSLFLRAEDSVLIARTWGRHWLIGTTDTPWDNPLDHPAATSADIEYLLRNLNRMLANPLTVDDVDGVFVGLRPLVKGREGATSKLSREHSIEQTVPGFTSIAGGKYTTYRVMAEDVIDAAVVGLGRPVPPSSTETIPLIGAVDVASVRRERSAVSARIGVPVSQVDRLVKRYGSLARELFEIIDADPSLAQSIPGAEDYLRAEARYAVTHEGALHLGDILTRRTHISIETADRGVAAARDVAALVASDLGWDHDRIETEVAEYAARVAAEIASQRLPTDEAAVAARSVSRDTRLRVADGGAP